MKVDANSSGSFGRISPEKIVDCLGWCHLISVISFFWWCFVFPKMLRMGINLGNYSSPIQSTWVLLQPESKVFQVIL